VTTSQNLQYVSYDRTYKGLPVVGGDFVLVTNGAGQVVFHSVAMEHPIGTLATTPSVTKAAAEALATKQLTTVTKVEGTQLVVNALGATPRLAWESTVDGFGADGAARVVERVRVVRERSTGPDATAGRLGVGVRHACACARTRTRTRTRTRHENGAWNDAGRDGVSHHRSAFGPPHGPALT